MYISDFPKAPGCPCCCRILRIDLNSDVIPVSSKTSRTAVFPMSSPGSDKPPGNFHAFLVLKETKRTHQLRSAQLLVCWTSTAACQKQGSANKQSTIARCSQHTKPHPLWYMEKPQHRIRYWCPKGWRPQH
uniref:Uncharacterized protein n=1 Tax=Micrurus spixii TaxID=129469 RepID=A0A2D4M495_9SAUR